ncbi:MAG TPA: LacI family DNA-binding transcriptional regulator [Steroidobacteraceae bacterium]|jgi:DNA-binding LacI/PurR family transcriptional regulator|nr:LacI family DNA-binding transcriptional regulator [Steroidobacteraceae bacterium]
MRDQRRRPNSLDIAHLAGVSQSTVSRALRADPMVSACTRERVLEVARQLNYHVDKNASNLRMRHSGTLALLFFEDPTADDSAINPFFHSMLGSIIRACSLHGYDLLVSFQDLLRDWHADYEDSHKADGIILLGYGDYVVHRSRLQPLIERGAHLVRWGPVLADQPGVSIGCDNVFGGRLAAAHLLALGRRRIAFLGDVAPSSPEMMERYRGYRAALLDAGAEPDPRLQVNAISTEASGYEAMLALLERGVPFDAVFGASDLIAIGALTALASAGRRVPDDVAVVGFDGIPMAAFTRPALTTVAQDTKRAGDLLVQTLIHLIGAMPAECVTLPPRLVVRGSCGTAPAEGCA